MLEIIEALSVIAAAFLLYHRFQQGRSAARLRKLLEQERAEKELVEGHSAKSAGQTHEADERLPPGVR